MAIKQRVVASLRDAFASQLRRNVAWTGLSAIANAGLAFVAYSINLRYLGLKSYGLWLALSVVSSAANMGHMGMAPAVTKFVAQHWAADERQQLQRTVAGANLITVSSMLCLALAIYLAKVPLLDLLALTPAQGQLALALLPWVLLLSVHTMVGQLSAATLAGLGRSDLTASLMTTGRGISVAVSWVLLSLSQGLWALVIGGLVGSLFIQVSTHLRARRICNLSPWRLEGLSTRELSRLARFGSGVMGSSLLQLGFLPLDRLLLTRYAGVETVPLFEVAWGSAMQVKNVLSGALHALMPDFSAASALGDRARLKHLMRRSYRLLLSFGIPVYLLLAVFAPFILTLWLGAEIESHTLEAFRIMLIGSFFSLLGVPSYLQLLGRGLTRDTFLAVLLQMLVNAGLALLLATRGLLQPSSLSLVAVVSLAAMTSWLVYRERRLARAR